MRTICFAAFASVVSIIGPVWADEDGPNQDDFFARFQQQCDNNPELINAVCGPPEAPSGPVTWQSVIERTQTDELVIRDDAINSAQGILVPLLFIIMAAAAAAG